MMPKIKWQPSVNGGWFFMDNEGNYWYRTANREVITVTAPDGSAGMGWTEEGAWNSLLTGAA